MSSSNAERRTTRALRRWPCPALGAALAFVFAVAWPVAGVSTDGYAALRAVMLEEIQQTVEYTKTQSGVAVLAPRVLEALEQVPRHEFVPEDLRARAYENRPLPIGYGQTISQPYIVALTSHLLDVGSDAVVLEVGTGSGYQAAILAELVDAVYSIEIVAGLADSAAERLGRLGYDNVSVRVGDGYYGWEDHAPYDAIAVTAAASHVPPPLVAQLKPGGRMVIPVGAQFNVQQLLLIRKDQQGRVVTEQILPVRFVPLTGGH